MLRVVQPQVKTISLVGLVNSFTEFKGESILKVRFYFACKAFNS